MNRPKANTNFVETQSPVMFFVVRQRGEDDIKIDCESFTGVTGDDLLIDKQWFRIWRVKEGSPLIVYVKRLRKGEEWTTTIEGR